MARGVLAGYPFRITGTMAFYILSRIELRNLCTVFVGKAAEADRLEKGPAYRDVAAGKVSGAGKAGWS